MSDPFTVAQIRHLQIFAYLNSPQLEAIATAFQQVRYRPGDRLFRQGELLQAFFVIATGEGQILQSFPAGEREVGRARPGDTFGESSLFLNEPRDSSVVMLQ